MEDSSDKAMMKEPLLGLLEEGLNDSVSYGFPRNLATYWEEAKEQFEISGPMIVVSVLQYSMFLISLAFVGHLGELSLSSASIATSFANVTGFSILLGMAGSLETLCGQAYGAKEYHLLGILLQRAIFTLLCASIPLVMIFMCTEKVLMAFGQDPKISYEAGEYAIWLGPGLFAHAFLQPLARFLQAQSIVVPMMLSAALALAFHAPICWFLMFKVGLGSSGAALATGVSYWFNVLLLLSYVKLSPTCSKTWSSLSTEALQDIKGFLYLAVPSSLMMCFENWSLESIVLISGLLPNPQLEMGVLSICLSTLEIAFRVPLGLAAAVSTRVANHVGAKRKQDASLTIQTAIALSLLESTCMGTLLVCVRNLWGKAFSNDREVIDYVSHLLPIIAAASILDSLQCILSGSVRGYGWQKLGAYTNLAAFYVVGLPIGIILAFVFHLGGKGLWIGTTFGLATQTILLFTITIFTDRKERKALQLE